MSRGQPEIIYTIGHSTRAFEELVALLKAHGVAQLADIRTMPRSRRHPHFAIESLAVTLPKTGIAYRHFPGLGGLRKPRPDSPNIGWRHAGFRGYADYMETQAFKTSLADLVAWATIEPTAIMCAEAVWWRCHRQLVADALVARGIEVRHITSRSAAPLHKLPAFARVTDGAPTYTGLI